MRDNDRLDRILEQLARLSPEGRTWLREFLDEYVSPRGAINMTTLANYRSSPPKGRP